MPYSYDVTGICLARLMSNERSSTKQSRALDFALTCKDWNPKLKVLSCRIKNYKEALEINLEANKSPLSLVHKHQGSYSYLGQNEKAKLLSRFLIMLQETV